MFNKSPAHGKAEARAGRQMMGMLSGVLGQEMTDREWSSWFYRYETELVRILKGWMQESEGKLPSFRGIHWDGVLEVLRENGGEGPALAREFERLHDRYEKAGDRDNVTGMEDALVDRMYDALDTVHSMHRPGGYYRVSENPDYDDSVMFDGVRGSAFGNLSGLGSSGAVHLEQLSLFMGKARELSLTMLGRKKTEQEAAKTLVISGAYGASFESLSAAQQREWLGRMSEHSTDLHNSMMRRFDRMKNV